MKLAKKRLARSLFALFVLSALVPLALLAALSLTQVRALLLQQGDQRLASTAKGYGMGVFERLLLATDIAFSASTQRLNIVTQRDSMAVRAFRDLGVVTNGRMRAIIGEPVIPPLDEEARARVDAGSPVLLVERNMNPPHLLLVVPGSGESIISGELRPDYVWGSPDELPTATDFCVVEDVTSSMLYCSSPEAREMLPGVRATAAVSSAAAWTRDNESMRAHGWSLFMRVALGTGDWIVIASQPEAWQLRASAPFQRMYILVVILALLLVTWFTVRKSRDILVPVTRLSEHARAIARNDFSARVRLDRGDEFGELAGAFNHMTRRLGRQFASLTALSEIDRLILTTQDTTQIVRTVLHRMDELVPADLVALMLIDQENPDHGRTFFRPPDNRQSMSMERFAVDAENRAGLQSEGWVDLAPQAAIPAYLQPMRIHGMARCYVQPIIWRGSMCGALATGFRDAAGALDEEERRHAAELADRLAVAVSSAWRDEQLYQQAHFDALTALPNRMLFKDRLDREIARGQRESNQFALLFIDLDHFKNVNDSFGHSLGDEVLREAGRRIQRCVRDSDTVSRLGGDEFTVLLTRLNHPQEAWLIGETMVATLSQEFRLGDHHCFLSASVGIASYPADGGSAEELLKAADTAMYRAKSNGRAQAVFFEEKMNREAVARMTLDRDLRAAIDRGELAMHYQPQIDLRTGAIRSAEALVRWFHPTHGLVSPLRFIPLAEESGFIEQIGRWTLEQACRQIAEWRREGLPIESVAVNVSPRQFRRRALVDFVRVTVDQAGIPPSCLEIEITEGMLLDRGEAVDAILRDFAGAGHRIALDDFGTGFSSMSYLKRLPVTTIKIDRVFIDGMHEGEDSEAIAAAIIAMSHALGKSVIAEGVETEAQEAILRRLHCDEVQGFLYAPALAPAEFAALVRSQAHRAVPA